MEHGAVAMTEAVAGGTAVAAGAAAMAAMAATRKAFEAGWITGNGIASYVGVTRVAVTGAYRSGRLPLPILVDNLQLWQLTPELQAAMDSWRRLTQARNAHFA